MKIDECHYIKMNFFSDHTKVYGKEGMDVTVYVTFYY